MSILLAAAALVAQPAAHSAQLTHRGHSVDVSYRGDVRVAHRQVGAAGAPGRPSSLRCAWSADVAVTRSAASASGVAVSRTFAAEPLRGSRPGWCAAQRGAIAAEVAAAEESVRARVVAAAEADRAALLAELDAAHDRTRG